MSKFRWLGLFAVGAFILTFLVSAIFFGLYLEESQATERENLDRLHKGLRTAEYQLKNSHPLLAYETVVAHQSLVEKFPELKEKWVEFALKSCVALKNHAGLKALYLIHPPLVFQNEGFAIEIAQNFLDLALFEEFNLLEEFWKTQTNNSEAWRLLNALSFSKKNQGDKSIDLLKNTKFDDQFFQVSALTQLALLNANENPSVPFNYLTEALKISPEISDLHYYRSQILTQQGHAALAEKSLQTALKLNPYSSLYREELLNHYIGLNQLRKASELIAKTPPQLFTGNFFLKSLFLHKIYRPIALEWAQIPIPLEYHTAFLRYLLALKPDRFWDSQLLLQQPRVLFISRNFKESSWLKLIEHLKNNQELKAFQVLQKHPHMRNLDPELFFSLQKVIGYKYSYYPLKQLSFEYEPKEATKHLLLHQLYFSFRDKPVQKIINDPNKYAILFLVNGWDEAALQLIKEPSFSSDLPPWITLQFIKTFETNRTIEEALAFGEKNLLNNKAKLLMGELYLKQGHNEKALAALQNLHNDPSPIGFRALELSLQILETEGKNTQAKTLLLNHSDYLRTVKGQEHLGKLDLRLGNHLDAEKTFASIIENSSIAKSFFAAKAYQKKDYKLAHKLTTDLFKERPDDALVKKQLRTLELTLQEK